MGIYIKDMEMPKEGFITVTITSDGRVVGNSKRESNKFEYLDNKDIATAVPVPPHGDLIDRDALPTSRVEWEDIFDAPTIIEAEEGE